MATKATTTTPARKARPAVLWICTTAGEPWTSLAPATESSSGGLADTGERDQTWRGFGGCFNELGWKALQPLTPTARDRVLRSLFAPRQDSCRFRHCRVPIGANDYAESWYSHNETAGDFAMKHFSIERDQKHLLPYLRAALAIQPETTLFASPWSPPTWMKFPQAYNHGTLVGTDQNLAAYALYLLRFVQAYRAEGLPVTAIHVQNEPNSDQKFPSCLWTGAQMRDFIRDHLGPRFSRAKLDCEIWAGTIERGDYNAWGNTIFSDAACRRLVTGMSFQWAGRGQVQRMRMSWPEVRLIQSEGECGSGSNSWGHAMHTFDLLWHYLTNGVEAYTYWNMVLPPGGTSTWGWKQNAMITVDPETRRVTYNPEFYVMKHLSRFVAPGARRICLRGPWTGNSLAFENPDGTVVVAVQNPHADARDFAFQGATGAVGGCLPPSSINTFVRST
ncbi:MAG TPA: glycoside hydrolase family 30 beta sandwich domain-containing protein [Armatimonadota bacterium]|jgi:glucosylceramidase